MFGLCENFSGDRDYFLIEICGVAKTAKDITLRSPCKKSISYFSSMATKKGDDTVVVTHPAVLTPDAPIDLQEGSSYFNFREPERSIHKLERRPPLEYRVSDIELEEFAATPDETETPKAVSTKMSFSFPKSKWRLLSACLWAFSQGFSDATPGTLLPYMEEYYNIGYSEVSLIWICGAVGVILVALFAHKILAVFGLHRSLCFACAAAIVMHSIISTGTKFPVICFAFFMGGMGLAIAGSHLNIFTSRFERASFALGCFHGAYGLGASVSPLISTAFVKHGFAWHQFYFVLIGLMSLSLVNVFVAFKGADEDMKTFDDKEETHDAGLLNLLMEALRNRNTWFMSLFVLFYQGGEVAVGGWIVTYIRDYRGNTDTSVGYVASGYWFGLTLGRFVITPLAHRLLGPRQGNIVLLLLSILFVGLTWAIPGTIGEAICVSFSGVTVGPIYPLMITLVAQVLPRKIQVVTLTFASAFGSSGAALFPFLIGLISQYAGAFVVLPAFIALFLATLVVWLLLPKINDGKGYNGALRRRLIRYIGVL